MSFVGLIKKTLSYHAAVDELMWLENIISAGYNNERLVQMAFPFVPKHIKKTNVRLDPKTENEFLSNMKFSPRGWNIHKLARVYIILHFDSGNEKKYVNTLNALFETADLSELDALYASLPLLHYPSNWLPRAKEAVRSNIGLVFDAVAFNNPYPSGYFDEAAWNQLVLKTIFTGKDIHQIHGLKERSNKDLASMISDFAHERWAAGRSVAPAVWELVMPFIDSHLITTIERLFQSENESDKCAAKLCCMNSDYEPAKYLLKRHHDLFTGKTF
jgi:hypothetical protein